MIDYDVLKAFGTTNDRLKEIFTAEPDSDLKDVMTQAASTGKWRTVGIRKGDETKSERAARARKNVHDLNVRERFRRMFQTRTEEGIVHSLSNWRIPAAVDLAWDTSVVTGYTMPLMMYAQKKINVERAAKLLTANNGAQFVKKNEAGDITGIDMPKFVEVNFNLIRSVITRRHAAQVNKFNQLFPYYKYEARSTGIVGKCRADVLSQRVDIMVDQFGYRHHDAQCMRDAFLYGHCVDFMRSSWEVEKQYQRTDFTTPLTRTPEGGVKGVETVITKEGVGWFNPHPSRVFWDNASLGGLSGINTDDINWMGFWDVCRFSEIDDNPHYFNKKSVGWTGRFWGESGVYNTYKDYFTHYSYTITPPATGEIDPAKANDVKAAVGFYSGNQRDASVFTNNMFTRIVPKDWGIGEYPWPIWIRTVTASDSTTIFAEIMPTTPAAYLGINENDARRVNVSMAMDLFAYQDQMTNLCTQLMNLCQLELFKIITINKDCFPGDEIKKVRAIFKGRAWIGEPVVIEASFLKLLELGIKAEDAIKISEVKVSSSISAVFEAMIKLVGLVEKLTAMSPAEQGQPAPREISATEVNEIATTTSSVYSFSSESIDEFRAAKKKCVYEALVAKGEGEIDCPVKDRYTPQTIVKAGFKPKDGEDEDFNNNIKGAARRQTIIGSKRFLVHDYIFTTRDGSERPVNTQAANTLVQLLGQCLSIPQVAQKMGKSKIYEIMNEIFRLSGSGFDLNLTLSEGEDDSFGADELQQIKQTLDQVTQYMGKMGGQLQKNAQDITALDQQEQDLKASIGHMATMADQLKAVSEKVNEIEDKHSQVNEDINKRLVESIAYKDAPHSIQAQMEAQAGFRPAPDSERASPAAKTNGK
jgi:hypothetical protein